MTQLTKITPAAPADNPLDTSDFYGGIRFHRPTIRETGEPPVVICGSSKADAQSALNEFRKLMAPADGTLLSRELVRLHVKTVRRAEGDLDLEAALEFYLEELRQYPGDIALGALQSWPGKFFPAWAELRERIEASSLLQRRLERIRALEAFLAGDERTADTRRPTEAQHARVADYVNQSRAAMNRTAEPTWTPEQIEALKRVDEVHGVRARAKGGKVVPVSEILGKGQWRVERESA